MLEKCISCKSSDLTDEKVIVESSEAKDSKNSSNFENSDHSEDIENDENWKFENDAAEVTFYRWQTIDKKINKPTIEVSFNGFIEMFKEEVGISKEHIHIKRRQVNAYWEIKASLTDNDLMVQVDFAESYKSDQRDVIQRLYSITKIVQL